jgi:hypothetical protein
VVERQGGNAELLAALDRELSKEERMALGHLVTVDLAARGFDAGYALTAVGRQLEDLIDALNDPGWTSPSGDIP